MSFFRTIASSFRSINRMGNEQSTEAASEPSEEEPAQSKPFDPNNLTDDSDANDTIAVRPTPIPTEPEPPPAPARSSQSAKKRRGTRKLRLSGQAEPQRSESQVEQQDQIEEKVILVSDVQEQPDSNMMSNTPLHDAQQGAPKQNPSRSKDEVMYPQLNDEASEEKIYSNESHGPRDKQDKAPGRLKLLQIKPQTIKGRFACPVAEQYNCDRTFALSTSAKRHAEDHKKIHQCEVCGKILSRADKLKQHKFNHTKAEVEAAAAHKTSSADNVENASNTEQVIIDSVAPESFELAGNAPEHGDSEIVINNRLSPDSATIVEEASAMAVRAYLDGSDELANGESVKGTQTQKSRLKRKRISGGSQLAGLSIDLPRKRRRRNSLSPPGSEVSGEQNAAEHQEGRQIEDTNEEPPTNMPQLSRNSSSRTGNLDNFVTTLTPGSQLRHPIHNPHLAKAGPSQTAQFSAPKFSHAGPSTVNLIAKTQKRLRTRASNIPAKSQTNLSGKKSDVVVTSPKGKRRAESGVNCSSPPPIDVSSGSEFDPSEARGMATTVARRSIPASVPRKRSRSPEDEDDSDVSLEPRAKVSSTSTKTQNEDFECRECKKKFKTKTSLQKHEKQPNVHSRKFECDDCPRLFTSKEALKTHQEKVGHGEEEEADGKKGAFSSGEVRKLHVWRDRFCDEYDLTIQQFNQMMTDSCRRGKGVVWPHRFVTKNDFLQQYFEVLPGRDRRSMRRYRERAFQNVPQSQEWTQEDDEELQQLVHELGTKWVEIGQRMTRTQDAVSQRWRFKVQYMDSNTHVGEWTKTEEDQLKDAVAKVKEIHELPPDPTADVRIPWDGVSKILKYKRTPQQCSNKWRLMYQKRQGNKFVKPTEIDKKLGTPPAVSTTPSKMSQRLAGQSSSASKRSRSSPKNYLSSEFVNESEDDSEGDERQTNSTKDRTVGSNPNSRRGSGLKQVSSLSDYDKQTKARTRKSETPVGLDNSSPTRGPARSQTPQMKRTLSQIFGQPQANTSALRAPNTSRKLHTQTEMPGPTNKNPQITSPWNAINAKSHLKSPEETETTEVDRRTSHDENAVMADPEQSDHSSQSSSSAVAVQNVDETTTTTSSAGSDEDEETSESESPSNSKAESSSSSAGSDADNSQDDAMVQDTQKDSFVQSLRSPSNRSSFSTRLERPSGERKNFHGIDFTKPLVNIRSTPQDEDESDSEDEGDIPYQQ